MKVIIAGGGTAGHINPAIAIAKYIKQRNNETEILFVGTKKGLETKLVPREGFDLKLITVKGFKRKFSFDTFLTIKELFQGALQARKIIKNFKPDLVIGTGGYVCGPVVFVASRMKIPTLIHEQNAFPGITNKLLSRFTDAVAISFKESKEYFKSSEKLILTGNPVRDEIVNVDRISARKNLNISQDKSVVVVVGGSRGAGKINDTVADMILNYYKKDDFHIIFATGETHYDAIREKLQSAMQPTIQIMPYIYNASEVYSAADLVLCRAGAITVSEMQVMGIPTIMVPSPNVTANHQEFNARALEKDGGTVVILEKDLNAELLYQQLKDLLKDKDQLGKMSRNAKKASISNATEKIYSIIQEITLKKKSNI